MKSKTTKHILTLSLAFLTAVGIITFFFAFGEGQGNPQPPSAYALGKDKSTYVSGENAVLEFLGSLPKADNSRSYIAVVDNDLDNDGNYDGLADYLAAMSALLVVLSTGIIFGAPRDGRLLLNLYKSTRLYSHWIEVLEKPG